MASIPSSGSLMATHNYRRSKSLEGGCQGLSGNPPRAPCLSGVRAGRWWGCLGCTDCAVPPGLPKSDPGQWWASFFFGKTNPPAMTTVSESPESRRVPGCLEREKPRGFSATPHEHPTRDGRPLFCSASGSVLAVD
uniref:Pancreatic progenitor cell differentiation and proliferation factor n=1 Tax=Anas platyrhynchos platyrhynchos TaxID=8840 RepID=A0A493SYC4_ANAPP